MSGSRQYMIDSDDEISTDDEIVEEIPIYLNKKLADKLYLTIYPTKKNQKNNDEALVGNVQMKPKAEILKMEFRLGDNFRERQHEFSQDGKPFQAHTFIGTPTTGGDTSKYLAGTIHEVDGKREMMVTPLRNILDMKVDFSYLDKSKEDAKKTVTAEDEQEEEGKEIQIKVRSNNAAKAAAMEKEKLKRDIEDEPWVDMTYHERISMEAQYERDELLYTEKTTSMPATLSQAEYFAKLAPPVGDKTDWHNRAKPNPCTISMAKLKTYPVVAQVEMMLLRCNMMTFKKVDDELDAHADDLLRGLQEVGVMLRGNWVIKSEILYKDMKDFRDITRERMVNSRNYVIYRFFQSRYVFRPEIIAITRLPNDQVEAILKSVSKVNKENRKWEPLLPDDIEFEKLHESLIKRQHIKWIAIEQTCKQMEADYEERTGKKLGRRD